jgi:hypothetical protein
MKITAYDIIEPLKNLIEAKELLDRVLRYYNVYSGQFTKVPDYEAEYMFKCEDGSYIKDTLNARIRDYVKFDDSE